MMVIFCYKVAKKLANVLNSWYNSLILISCGIIIITFFLHNIPTNVKLSFLSGGMCDQHRYKSIGCRRLGAG